VRRREKSPVRAALYPAAARRLWEESEKLVTISSARQAIPTGS